MTTLYQEPSEQKNEYRILGYFGDVIFFATLTQMVLFLFWPV